MTKKRLRSGWKIKDIRVISMSLEKSLELDVIIQEIEDLCVFSRGKKIIHELKPSYDRLIIKRENECIREALQVVVHYGDVPFLGIRDIGNNLSLALKGRSLTGLDLIEIANFIQGVKGIIDFEKTIEFDHPALNEYFSSLMYHQKTCNKIKNCINDYGEVVDNASSNLQKIRGELRRADNEIQEAMNKFIHSHANSIVDGIVTTRNGRSVVLVKASEKNTFGGLVYGDSASGQASYIEPAAVVRANNHKQELLSKEQDEVAKILRECTSYVQETAEEELANLDTCALLDALFAKANWGKRKNAVVSKLSEERKVEFIKARHPLIADDKVVSNTYHLEDPKRILLITGPNTGGKTVSMKIFGLFVLMTYCGIPVTCESASVPFFDRVFADIGDDQSVVSSLSSFSAHTKKQAEIARFATENSLVLLDEVGSGTDPQEGESLAISLLNELRKKCAMTIATTHFNRLKAYGKRHDDILLASVEFDMKNLQPTYRYVEGLTGQSNAFEVALRYGLPKHIVNYARFLKGQAKTQEDKLIETLDAELHEARKKEEEYNAKLEELNQKMKKLEKEQRAFEIEKSHWKQNAEEEAEKYIENAKLEADEILKEMRKQKHAKYHEVLNTRNKLNNDEINELPVENTLHEDFEVGDVVELASSNQVARILEIRKKDIVISLNGRELHVKKNQLRPSLKMLPKEKSETFVTVKNHAVYSSMPLECNLIGLHVDEAMDKLDGYMDEARLYGLTSYRIIHGDGSGVLRKAVHERLKRNKYVESYRIGMPQEGGTGATVVEIKK